MNRYRFGPFNLDAESGELNKHGSRIRLQKQPFQILLTLIERAGQVVSRNDLREIVWGTETFVDFDHGLNAAVNKIRRTLGDSSDRAIYIETLPGAGYRFVYPVEKPEEAKPAEAASQEPEAPAAVPGRRRWRWFAAAGTVVTGLLAIGYFALHRPPKLTDKDTVVLADFTNSTGDVEFDDMLREALAIQLEESPFLKVLEDDRVIEDLQLMRQPAGTRITNGLGREICQRENEKVMIHGSIASAGKALSITLQATDCQSGTVLARQQIESPDRERALEAVATAAKGLRGKLGESLSSISRPTQPGDRVTTTSLAAFRTFALGAAQFRRGNYIAAIPIFRHALELDPDFEAALLYLAISYQVSGDNSEHLTEALQRAFDLRDRVSERERLVIAPFYYYYVMHDWEKTREAAELSSRSYPRDYIPRNTMGLVWAQEGNLEDSLREFQLSDQMGNSSVAKGNVAVALIRLNRFDEARTYIRNELARNPDNVILHRRALEIELMQEDEASSQSEVQWFSARPAEYMSIETQATNSFVRGQRRHEAELRREARELRTRLSLAAFAFSPVVEDALTGNCESARRTNSAGAVALALCSDSPQLTAALKNAQEAAAAQPNNNDLALADIMAQVAISISENQPAEAVAHLATLKRIERRHPEVIYLRGLAYLRWHKGAEAATEFQKIVDQKGNYWGPYYPASYVGLARSEALAEETPRARQAYRDFLALWRNADPDIPLLRQAKAEYAALK